MKLRFERKKLTDETNSSALQQVVGLVQWQNYDKLMNKLFYEKFGTVLESTLDRFQEDKRELKECIRREHSSANVRLIIIQDSFIDFVLSKMI